MKKATLSIGLLTLMMVLTSFTSPIDGSAGQSSGGNRKVDVYIDIDGSAGQSSGGNRKVDFMASRTSKQITSIDIDGSAGQSSGGNRKVD